MVERARQTPPAPHDPMRFRAVPPGDSDSDDEGLPASYRNPAKMARKEARRQAQALAQGQAQGQGQGQEPGTPASADACATMSDAAVRGLAAESEEGADAQAQISLVQVGCCCCWAGFGLWEGRGLGCGRGGFGLWEGRGGTLACMIGGTWVGVVTCLRGSGKE